MARELLRREQAMKRSSMALETEAGCKYESATQAAQQMCILYSTYNTRPVTEQREMWIFLQPHSLFPKWDFLAPAFATPRQ